MSFLESKPSYLGSKFFLFSKRMEPFLLIKQTLGFLGTHGPGEAKLVLFCDARGLHKTQLFLGQPWHPDACLTLGPARFVVFFTRAPGNILNNPTASYGDAKKIHPSKTFQKRGSKLGFGNPKRVHNLFLAFW